MWSQRVIDINAMKAWNKRMAWFAFRQKAKRSSTVLAGIADHVLMCCVNSAKEVLAEYLVRRYTALKGAFSSALVVIFIQRYRKPQPMKKQAAASIATVAYSGEHARII
jgi:hypothetical protein